MGSLIGGSLGEVVEVNLEENELALCEFIRVRINLDIKKPLPKGKKVNVGTKKPCCIWFSYEWLPNFCYQCGRLGYEFKECVQGGGINVKAFNGYFPYSQWPHVGPNRERDWRKPQKQAPRPTPQMAACHSGTKLQPVPGQSMDYAEARVAWTVQKQVLNLQLKLSPKWGNNQVCLRVYPPCHCQSNLLSLKRTNRKPLK